MWNAWSTVKKKLRWNDGCAEISEHLTLEQATLIKHWGDKEQAGEFRRAIGQLRRAGISTVKEGEQALERHQTWSSALYSTRCSPEDRDRRRVEELESWLRTKILVQKAIHELGGWVWIEDQHVVQWELTTKEWTGKLHKKKEFSEYLNSKWGCNNKKRHWEWRWTTLWKAAIHNRRTAWIWRFLHRGYFTGSRSKGWAEEHRNCLRCGSTLETLEHAFWTCSRIQSRHTELKELRIIPREHQTRNHTMKIWAHKREKAKQRIGFSRWQQCASASEWHHASVK
ncbi:hypothetical protein R1sor_000685 [Riccia sorocarpa]|uniref:Reverse transcriptase zinc-binding domain-containing protein n=1 Tax=Riccia sorocarpa TaxID=122646 RepID=A0ABD3GU46_9MARC